MAKYMTAVLLVLGSPLVSAEVFPYKCADDQVQLNFKIDDSRQQIHMVATKQLQRDITRPLDLHLKIIKWDTKNKVAWGALETDTQHDFTLVTFDFKRNLLLTNSTLYGSYGREISKQDYNPFIFQKFIRDCSKGY